jgi:two-component system OmpR family sensor kinase
VTIRLRLAVMFTLLVGGILVLTGVTTYQLLRQGLLDEIERDVARRATMFAATAQAAYDVDVFGAPDVFLQVVDSDGRVVAASGNLGARELPAPDANGVVEVHVGERPLFLSTAPLPDGGRVVVARSPVTTYGALRELRRLLTGVVAVALVVTGGLAWLFARTALRPIDVVVRAAKAVKGSRDLSQRVPHRGRQDEVGRLAGTFNAMLAELDDAYQSLDLSNQRLRQFLADCSHELRTPLTLILGNLDLLARTGERDPESETRSSGSRRSRRSGPSPNAWRGWSPNC